MTTDERPPAGSELWKKTAFALDGGDFSALDVILSDAQVSIIDLLDANGRPPKYMAEALTWASFIGLTDVVRELLDRGVDPAAGFETGMAAAHWAANRGNLDVVRLLIERGAPLEQKNMYDGTVLGATLWSVIHETRDSHPEIVEELVRAGAKYDREWVDWWSRQEVPSDLKEKVAEILASGL